MNHLNASDEIIFALTENNNPVFNVVLSGFLSYENGTRDFPLPENASAFGYLVRGEAEIISSGSSFKVSPEQMFFVSAAASSGLQIKLSDDTFGYWFSCNGTLPEALATAYSIPTVTIRNANVSEIIIKMKDLLFQTNSDNYTVSMKKMSSLFFEMMLEFAFADITAPTVSSKKKVSEADNIRTYIDNTIYTDISLDDIKDHFGITKMHAIRVFKAKFDMTPMQYAIKRRADIAATLLQTTALPIKTISDMLHYSNTQHFSNTFKKLIGTSPNKYRVDAKKKA